MGSKKNYDGHKKVQFKTEGTSMSSKRHVYYRVVPSELNLWDRIFNNKWKQLFRPKKDAYLGFTTLYTPEDFANEISPLKNLADVNSYIKETRIEVLNIKYDKLSGGKIWYDEV